LTSGLRTCYFHAAVIKICYETGLCPKIIGKKAIFNTVYLSMNRTTIHSKEYFFKHRDLWLCLFLVAATLAVYWQVHRYDFVELDDTLYLTENRHVQAGFTTEGIIWSFTNTEAGQWIPLVWISYMAGCQVYGISPGWHHITNVCLHLVNILFLFILFKRLTGCFWHSAFVAALFALHPLHVESVAWITERKDVLSTFFFLLTIWIYARYVEHPRTIIYLATLLVFTLGLMSKPMLVTTPFLLLLLDFWPLQRFNAGPCVSQHGPKERPRLFYLILEKIPFLEISAIAGTVTLITAHKAGGVDFFTGRVANALVSYVAYIAKLIWPAKLAVFYPHPGIVPGWKAAGALVLLAAITLIVIRNIQQRPYLIVGWFWYLGTLVPVIGLVQAGTQGMADRFVYVPLIGLYICIAWGFPELFGRRAYKKTWLAVLATVLFAILMAVTWKQVGYWQNSVTLFEHALEVTSRNWLLHNNLGIALEKQKRTDQAIAHYLAAVRIKPDYAQAHFNLGHVLEKRGRTDQAINHYLEALRIKQDYPDAYFNLGNTLARQGFTDEAIGYYLKALRIKPDFSSAHNNMGIALIKKGDIKRAMAHFREALRINPDNVSAKNNLKTALMSQRQKR